MYNWFDKTNFVGSSLSIITKLQNHRSNRKR